LQTDRAASNPVALDSEVVFAQNGQIVAKRCRDVPIDTGCCCKQIKEEVDRLAQAIQAVGEIDAEQPVLDEGSGRGPENMVTIQ
jgi:hypothetical protein